jgi:predicted PurR-regulated permease PerM
MKKIICAVLHEWKFLVLVAVLLFGIISINESIQELSDVLSSLDYPLSNLSELSDIDIELGRIESDLSGIDSELSKIESDLSGIDRELDNISSSISSTLLLR